MKSAVELARNAQHGNGEQNIPQLRKQVSLLRKERKTPDSKAANDAPDREIATFGSMAEAGPISVVGKTHAEVILEIIDRILSKGPQ